MRLLAMLALACVAGVTVLGAQEAPPETTEAPTETSQTPPVGESTEPEKIEFPDAPDPTATPPAPPPADPDPQNAPVEGEEEEPPPDAPPRTPGVVGPTPGRFEPSEKVRADFDVSFPVDI